MRIMACGTGCLCLVVLVSATMLVAVLHPDKFSIDKIGHLSKGSASGVAALVLLQVALIKVSLGASGKKGKT